MRSLGRREGGVRKCEQGDEGPRAAVSGSWLDGFRKLSAKLAGFTPDGHSGVDVASSQKYPLGSKRPNPSSPEYEAAGGGAGSCGTTERGEQLACGAATAPSGSTSQPTSTRDVSFGGTFISPSKGGT